MSNDSYLIVGLGNPGAGYSANRHNVGQMALDVLAARIGGSYKKAKTNAVVAEGRLVVAAGAGSDSDGPRTVKVVLAKSTGYMNTSGGPVSALLKFYDIPLSNLIVLHDELDIDAEKVRLKFAGGHGGHNGLRDIIAACDGGDFARVRIGIGRPPGQMDTADYVLRDFSSTERKELPTTLEIAADAVEAIIAEGLAKATMRFHV
jgi:peptidyl-tRNA hydrolase, PTH1 family